MFFSMKRFKFYNLVYFLVLALALAVSKTALAPAKAGAQLPACGVSESWFPAFAGMTGCRGETLRRDNLSARLEAARQTRNATWRIADADKRAIHTNPTCAENPAMQPIGCGGAQQETRQSLRREPAACLTTTAPRDGAESATAMTIRFWSDEQLVNTTLALEKNEARITQLADGNIVVVWSHAVGVGDSDIRMRLYDSAGQPIGGEISVADGGSLQRHADVVALNSGGFVVTHFNADSNTIHAYSYDATGLLIGNTVVAIDENLNFPFVFQFPPIIKALPGDKFVIVYDLAFNGSADRDVYARVVDASNPTDLIVGPSQAVATSSNDELVTDIAVTSSKIIVVWYDNTAGSGDVFIATFDHDLTNKNVVPIKNTAIIEKFAALAALNNDTVVIAWVDGRAGGLDENIWGQILDNDGNKIGGEFQLNGTHLGRQSQVKITALADGKFLAVYSTFNTAETAYAQMFNPDGSKIGGEVVLTDSANGPLAKFEIVTLSDGRVAVTWSDLDIDGENAGIAMRILDPRDGFWRGTAADDTIYGNDGVGTFSTAKAALTSSSACAAMTRSMAARASTFFWAAAVTTISMAVRTTTAFSERKATTISMAAKAATPCTAAWAPTISTEARMSPVSTKQFISTRHRASRSRSTGQSPTADLPPGTHSSTSNHWTAAPLQTR
jgi:YD repeat-containing protein